MSVRTKIRDLLEKGGPHSIEGTSKVLAVAILCEEPEVALPEVHQLAGMLVDGYKPHGWVPRDLSVDSETPVAIRFLIEGVEISPTAGLAESALRERVASMLSELVREEDAAGASAVCFYGESRALGQTWIGVVAA
jgi:hypothetical protein